MLQALCRPKCLFSEPAWIDLLTIFRLTSFLDRFVDTYSLGTRQKLAVLLALIGAPWLIVLDEAFNGLDPASARSLKQHLRGLVEAQRASVLLATHAVDVVERYADRAALMLSESIVKIWTAENISVFRDSGSLEEVIAAAAQGAIQSE